MKTLQESIIGRKGTPIKFTKNMLEPGYIVQYWDLGLAMYFDYKDIKKICSAKETREILPSLHNQGCFLGLDWDNEPEHVPIFLYNVNLTTMEPNHPDDNDIIAVWPVKTQPQLLDQESLGHLIKGIEPIKINQ